MMEKPIAMPTAREIQILQAMARGLTSKQIAFELRISEKTVETHRKNLQQKFDAINASQLIYTSTKLGFI